MGEELGEQLRQEHTFSRGKPLIIKRGGVTMLWLATTGR